MFGTRFRSRQSTRTKTLFPKSAFLWSWLYELSCTLKASSLMRLMVKTKDVFWNYFCRQRKEPEKQFWEHLWQENTPCCAKPTARITSNRCCRVWYIDALYQASREGVQCGKYCMCQKAVFLGAFCWKAFQRKENGNSQKIWFQLLHAFSENPPRTQGKPSENAPFSL